LEAAGWLAVVDRAGLAAYCLAWAQMVWADGVLLRDGAIVEEPVQTARGEKIGVRLKAHPAAKIHADASRRVKMFLAEFGLTPASRQRLEGDGPAADAPAGNRVLAIRDRIEQARSTGPA
jgi:P27 family predicted phage terminase small subunit